LKALPVLPIAIVQTILFLAHWYLYRTWVDFWLPISPDASIFLRAAFTSLSVSFIVATMLGFRYDNAFIKSFYRIACIWLGIANFLFVGAMLAWLIDLALRLALPGTSHLSARPYIAALFLIVALATALRGIFNARKIHERHITVRLPDLPASWRGRTALLISDLHLGHINGKGFAAQIASMVRRIDPAVLFIAGDLYDGVFIDPETEASPLWKLQPPLGAYFISGNHEAFGGTERYERAVSRAGIRVLHNQRVVVDGVHIIGVPYGNSTTPLHLRTFLENLNLNNGSPSILLNHVPNCLPIAEKAGVSLQLSGHTHSGQFFPFNLVTQRIFGQFTHGLQQFGNMQVYTSSGCGTWGPPMRVGTQSEIVLLTFE
jgi:uncharacterized protein